MVRFLIPIIIIGVVVWFFMRKTPQKQQKTKKEELSGETMVECLECGTYISLKEAYSHKGKHFCSKKCLEKELR